MQEIDSLEIFQNLSLREREKTYLSVSALREIKVKDNKEPLIDLAEFFAAKKMPIFIDLCLPEIKKALVREKVALKLFRVAKKLAPKFCLKIVDAFRPISIQARLFKEIQKDLISKNPHLRNDPEKLYIETTKFIMDPKAHPPHATGGAIDLTLVTLDGKELDMGSPINQISDLAITFCSSLPKKAIENRYLLFSEMRRQGFVNLPTEWWHYSYGDQYWAAFNKKSHTLYGEIEKSLFE